MKLFSNLKIKVKLVTCFIIVAIFTGIVGFVGISNMKAQNKSVKEIFNSNFIPSQELAKVQKNLLIIRSDYLLMLYEKNMANFQQRVDEINKLTSDNDKLLGSYEASIDNQNERDLFNTLKTDRMTYINLRTEGMDLIKGGKFAEAEAALPEATKARVKLDDDLQQLISLNENMAADTNQKNDKDFAAQSTIMIIIVIAAALLAIALGLILASILDKPLKQLLGAANKVADGDLNVSIDIDAKDEIGTLASAFRKMANNTSEIMSNIHNAAEQVASGAKQVSDTSMALSQGATEQATSIEQLTASIEEISSQTRSNADSANEANHLTETVKANAVQGNNQMKEMLKAMGEINDASSSISKIIKVIDEIAFQTNILALNAAVEAARAGQHGKGFAVVAEEVRNLAARSADAAKETTIMIEGSIKKVEDGTNIATETAEALNKIVNGIAKVANIVSDIAIASNEQALGIAQINQGVMQISQVVQTNSATSEESAAASEELSSQADFLREQVSRFKLKRSNYLYDRMEEISPELLRLIENMNYKKKYDEKTVNEAYEEAAVTTTKAKKIALSDREFGKY